MSASPAWSGAAWGSVVAALVFLALLVVLVVDRVRLKRRLTNSERSEALQRTDLDDARREIAALRDIVQARSGSPTPGSAPVDRPVPGDPTRSVS